MLNLSPRKRTFALAVITSMVALAGCARVQESKLLVSIVVDGLERQYIDLLRESFGKGGFNRLMSDGVTIENADFGTYLDATAATALLLTGAEPDANGIDASQYYDRTSLRVVDALVDPSVMGNFTSLALSPKNLAVTTLSDEARIAGAGVSYAYAIAADPSQAVIMGGHCGNSALWLNDATGNWASSTYYTDLPSFVASRNRTMPLSARADTMQWTPLRPASFYPLLPDHVTHYPFRHTLRAAGEGKMQMLAATPLLNTEITALAREHMRSLRLGTHSGGTDVLNIAYTIPDFTFAKSSDTRFELYDTYLRLDRDLEQLFSSIDSSLGAGNYTVFLSGTPRPPRRGKDDERWNVPYGEFSTRKAVSLLNVYLIALHGNGDWVQGYHNGQFYLNHRLINDRNISLELIRSQAAGFLGRMSGVRDARSLESVLAPSDARARNVVVSRAGDVFVEVQPGWEIVDDYANVARTSTGRSVAASSLPMAPAFIMSPGVSPQLISAPVDARALAPAVAGLLHIRSPNAASVPPLRPE